MGRSSTAFLQQRWGREQGASACDLALNNTSLIRAKSSKAELEITGTMHAQGELPADGGPLPRS